MARIDNIAHSGFLPSGESGELIASSREEAGWQWMSYLNFLAGTSRTLADTEDPRSSLDSVCLEAA